MLPDMVWLGLMKALVRVGPDYVPLSRRMELVAESENVQNSGALLKGV